MQVLLHVQVLICSRTFILHVQFNNEYSVGPSSLGVIALNTGLTDLSMVF